MSATQHSAEVPCPHCGIYVVVHTAISQQQGRTVTEFDYVEAPPECEAAVDWHAWDDLAFEDYIGRLE